MPSYDQSSGLYYILAFGELFQFASLKAYEVWLANQRILGVRA